MQPVFQNPYASLDPLYSIYQSIEEPLHTHEIGTKKEREAKIRDLLDKVSLPTLGHAAVPGRAVRRPASARGHRPGPRRSTPRSSSATRRCRRSTCWCRRRSSRCSNDLQAELGLSYLFITHDLAVVRQIADDVLVMQDGKVVEAASVTQVFDDPREDYTKKLLDAIPGGSIQLGV